MPPLITALLVKDERARYLERVLRRCLEFSDHVLVLDDGSSDGSPDLARDLGCRVGIRTGETMWGAEAPARAELWQWGAEVAGERGWLLIADADQILHGDPRPLLQTTQHNAWAFPLYDCWNSETTFRADDFWQGYQVARPWLFKPSALREPPAWPARGLHTGHCPANYPLHCGIADSSILSSSSLYWSHLAYVTPEHRREKYERYMSRADQLGPFELAHAKSILD